MSYFGLPRVIRTLSVLASGGDYRIEHTAPGKEGAPLYDLTVNEVYPKDVYSTLHHYVDGDPRYDYDSLAVISSVQGKPDARVTIYRALPAALVMQHKKDLRKWLRAYEKDPEGVGFAPAPPIHPGDWVTLSERYAKLHAQDLEGRGKNGKIVSKRVKASTVWTNGDSINEWGYWP